MDIRSAGKTDIGLKRKVNEDSYLMAPDLGLYVIADGMGGHKAGDVASCMVVETIEDYWRKVNSGDPPAFLEHIQMDISNSAKHLVNSISFANIMVYEAQKKPQYYRMGSTIVALLLEEDTVWAANVGDSRIYLFDHGDLIQISEEHSLETEQKAMGIIGPDGKSNTTTKNVITRAIGQQETVKVFITPIQPEAGNIILMCSDGLTDYTSEQNISMVIDDFSTSLERKVDVLIDGAKRGGGGDNISVILLEVLAERKWNKFKKKIKI
jgi:serine/threonine protein phosphatase PrpC